jgi:hypothetical protein
MAESLFWRDLERRFRNLQAACRNSMKAKFMESTSGSAGDHWRLDGASEAAMRTFAWLAERGAVELGYDGSGPNHWLNLLKQDSSYYRETTLEHWDRDHDGIKSAAGVISCVCGASAEYCIKCEGLMISASRRKRQARTLGELATGARESRSSKADVPSGNKKPGPKTDIESARTVARIVAEIAPNGEWREHLEQICEALDDAKIRVPATWAKQKLRCWADCDETERVVLSLRYRLRVAKKQM